MNEAPSAAVRAHPQRLDNLIDACKALKPVETGVVYPLSGDALMGAVEAGRDGLITPVLIGPADAIRALAKKEGGDLGSIAPAQRVFVGDEHAVRLPDRRRDRIPIKGIQAAQVHQLDLHSLLALQLLRGLQGPGYHGTIGDHGQVLAGVDDFRFAEGNHVFRTGIRSAPESLTVKALVLEKQHRVVAANRSTQQARRIQCVRRKNHAQTRNVGEHALAALRVINRAAGQISANRHANYHGT